MSKKKKIDKQFIGSLTVFLVPLIIGILFYSQMPDRMAIHFNSKNVADGFASKWVALFGIPLFLMIVHCITKVVIERDSRRENQSRVIQSMTNWMLPGLAIVMQITVISFGLERPFEMVTYLIVAVGVFFVILGNYLPKTKQNNTIGIRLPWTLASEENWNKTHHMTGWLWMVCGLIITILGVLEKSDFVGIIFIGMFSIPIIYSYLIKE